jgi:hypothetical protein
LGALAEAGFGGGGGRCGAVVNIHF